MGTYDVGHCVLRMLVYWINLRGIVKRGLILILAVQDFTWLSVIFRPKQYAVSVGRVRLLLKATFRLPGWNTYPAARHGF